MTWWGALGLALSLYGVVVLLEWLYDQIVGSRLQDFPAVSVVIRVMNQETCIEQAMRELLSLFEQKEWERRAIEVVISDGGSSDQTSAIIERLSRRHPFLNVVEGNLATDEVMARCQYSIVVWMDLSGSSTPERLMSTLRRLLGGLRPVE